MSICFCTFSLTSFSSVQFSCSVFSNSLRSHDLQHDRHPCPTPTPGACSNSCPLSQWYHPTISSSVIPFFSCLKSFPASGSFLVTQLFASGDQSTEASASSSVLTMITQDWFPLGLTRFDLLAVQATSKSLLQHHTLKASVLRCSALFMVQLSHLYITTEKTIALTVWNLSEKSCHEQHSQFLIRNPWCQMHPENHTFWEPSKIVSDKIVPQQDQNSSVQLLSRVWLFVTPRITARQASFHHQLPEFTKTRVHRVGDAI